MVLMINPHARPYVNNRAQYNLNPTAKPFVFSQVPHNVDKVYTLNPNAMPYQPKYLDGTQPDNEALDCDKGSQIRNNSDFENHFAPTLYDKPITKQWGVDFNNLVQLGVISRITRQSEFPLGFASDNPTPRSYLVRCIPRLVRDDSEMQPLEDVNVYLLGHSFISRLGDVVENTYHSLYDVVLDMDDNLLSYGVSVEIKGKSGAKFSYIEQYTKKLEEFKVGGVLIEIGSNDLCLSSCKPETLAKLVTETANGWIHDGLAKAVVICHVLHRSKLEKSYRCDKTLEQYNLDVDIYNVCLAGHLQDNPKVTHWRHAGMRFPPVEVLCPHDGVHPYTLAGFKKYTRSLTYAIRRCRKMVLGIA